MKIYENFTPMAWWCWCKVFRFLFPSIALPIGDCIGQGMIRASPEPLHDWRHVEVAYAILLKIFVDFGSKDGLYGRWPSSLPTALLIVSPKNVRGAFFLCTN